jgi:putative peptidoglycan binding protein
LETGASEAYASGLVLEGEYLSMGMAGRLTILALGGSLLVAGTQIYAQNASAAHPKAKTSSAHSTSHKTSGKSKKSGKKTKTSWRRGQQKIDSQRAREIQEALIREHYLDGQATGTWNDASQKAMERFQADNGWQSKSVPDSRALIKLGLGPDHQHLLNPESAMTTMPVAGPSAPKDEAKTPPQR